MNIIYIFLKELGVHKVTEQYCMEQYFSEPMSDTLLGVKRLLARMGVPTQGVQFEVPIDELPFFPSIVHLGDKFDVATAKNWDKLKTEWDGIALMPMPFDADSVKEPHYRKNRWIRFFDRCCQAALLILPIFMTLLTTPITTFGGLTVATMLLDVVGIATCIILLQKNITGYSAVGDKLCSVLGERGNCNIVLNSPAAKVMGFSWSEIGLGYFVAHLMALPNYLPIVVPISLCAMLFAFWSIWYQWRRMNSWCLPCLLTQAVLWAQGILLIVWSSKSISCSYWLTCMQSLQKLVGCLYFVAAILVSHYTAGYLTERRQRQLKEWTMRRLLCRKDIFTTLLNTCPTCPYADDDINERMGCADASPDRTIVIYTSPSICVHCKALLTEEQNLLDIMGERIAICHINLDIMDSEQRAEVRNRLNINAIPSIFIRHHKLPHEYSLSDLAALWSE